MWQQFRSLVGRAPVVLVFIIAGLTAVDLVSVDCAAGADPNRRLAIEGVIRIANRQAEGASLGSGTVIAREKRVALVLTCAHLFSDGVGELLIVAPDARPKRALLVAIDEENDLACLIMQQAKGATLPVAKELPDVGSRLASCGFGQEGVFGINRGEHLCYATLKGGERLGILEMAGSARQGDSGGPILNQQSEVVGVIMGTDGETVNGTHCERIRAFLAEHPITPAHSAELARLVSRPIDEYAALVQATFDGTLEDDASVPATVRLSGRVSFDDRAVSGARVRLSGLTERVSTLDTEGHFVFDDLPAGRYYIDVEKIVKNRVRAASQSILVSRARSGQEIELQLE